MAKRLYYITKAEAVDPSKCRKWFVRVPIGYLESRDKNGNPFIRWKTKTIHGTKSDAEVYGQRHAKEFEKLNPASNPDISACDYMDMMNRKELEGGTRTTRPVAQNTYDKRRGMIKCARLTLKDKQLAKVTVEDLRGVLRAARAGITPSGKCYEDSSAGTLKDTLSHFFTLAFEDGLIPSNPALYIKAPRSATHTDGKAIDDDLLQTLEASLDVSETVQRGLYILIISGMRPGELCGLQWRDISFKDCSIHIQRALTNKGILKIPKTEAGNRVIPITAEQLQTLAAIYEQEAPCGNDFVIYNNNYKPHTPNNLAKRWRRIRPRHDMQEYTLKDFRHTYATSLARAGCTPKEIQVLMGHKDERIALRIYQHVQNEQQKRAAVERLNQYRKSLKK